MKGIVSVVGIDKPGIVAAVSTCLAENKINIIDIAQSYADEFFTMILIVDFDTNKQNITLKEMAEKLKVVGEEIGLFVSIQHEDVFRAMHRI